MIVITQQYPHFKEVFLERKECVCGQQGHACDNWKDVGVFNFNTRVLVGLPLMFSARQAVRTGTPISTFFFNFWPLTEMTWDGWTQILLSLAGEVVCLRFLPTRVPKYAWSIAQLKLLFKEVYKGILNRVSW